MERAVRAPLAAAVVALLAAAAGASPAGAASGWAPVADPLTHRFDGMTTVLADGRVMTIGGRNDREGIARSAAVYDPAADRWTEIENSEHSRRFATLTTLRDGRVLQVSGQSNWYDDPVDPTVDLYDPGTDTWTSAGRLTRARYGHVAALLPDGRVLVAGGLDTSGAPVTQAEIYDPVAGTWSDGGTMAQAGYRSQSVVLPDGRVLVAGGSTTAPDGIRGPLPTLAAADLARTEIFDPASNAWSPAGPLGQARAQGGAAVLSGGRVLVAGGLGAAGAVAPATRFDPATSAWTPGNVSSVTGSTGFVAPFRGNRALLVAEGQRTTPTYVGDSDSWFSSTAMGSARSRPQHAQLADGRVLVFGGYDTTTSELYTPPTRRTAADADLGEAAVGGTVERDVVVRNDGPEALFTAGVTTAGADASAFTIVADGCSGTRVAVGDTCVVRVRFTPAAVGPREATLAFDDNAETSEAPELRAVGTERAVDPGPTDPTPTTPTGPTDPTPTAPTGPAGPTPPAPVPGGGSPAPVAPRPVPVPVPCTVRSVVLFGVAPTGTSSRPRVRLSAVATGLPAGTVVRVRRDGAQVGSTAVRADGTVVATVAAPGARRARLAARYRLVPVVGRRSAALKATRLATIRTPRALSGGRVRVSGRVAGVTRATRLRIERTPACGPAKVTVGTITTDRRGAFRAVLAAPAAGEGATVYRIRQGRRTVTLPVVVGARG